MKRLQLKFRSWEARTDNLLIMELKSSTGDRCEEAVAQVVDEIEMKMENIIEI